MKKIGVAIIGCGMIAGSHADALLADGRAEIRAAAYGTNIQKGEAFAKKYNVPKIVGDYHELLDDPEIDMICLCTPSGIHGECAIDFARAGKHILCEKPLDIKGDVMTAMIDEAERANVKLGCVFPNRTIPGLNRAKKILESGELGAMKIVEFQYRGYRSHSYYTSSKWKGTRKYDGGGCLMNQGIHGIDAMLYLTGDVARVCAQVGALGRDIEVEDTASAIMQFANGAQGTLMGTTLSYMPESAPEGDRMRIECEKGSILYSEGKTYLYRSLNDQEFDVEVTSLDDENAQAVDSGATPENINMEGHTTIVSNFITAVIEDKPVLIPARSARRGVDLVLAIYESSEKGCWVDVNYGE